MIHGPANEFAQRAQRVGAHAVNDHAAIPEHSHKGCAQGIAGARWFFPERRPRCDSYSGGRCSKPRWAGNRKLTASAQMAFPDMAVEAPACVKVS